MNGRTVLTVPVGGNHSADGGVITLPLPDALLVAGKKLDVRLKQSRGFELPYSMHVRQLLR